ncbi:hypothetical protein LTR78_000330 [Recurvomyces mirabilis]|uniref:Uncharacterized protein n=1 Tax=Recurvomyces mirabilis TaxID=574656 RepID=A0AAE1C6G8_9PEZI|nr:hypothetical protein LTR78_000330 [Recurvomyces mirabilis]KAK5161985.1 hypothetical protein LTS14_000331 [Recurvomyces mirabilis]
MINAKKALAAVAEAFYPPLYRADPSEERSSHTHPFSPGPFASTSRHHDAHGRVKSKTGKKHVPMVERGGAVDERKARSTKPARPRSWTMPNLGSSFKRSASDPIPRLEVKKVELKKDEWLREYSPKVLGEWKPGYNVFSHLDEKIAEMKKEDKRNRGEESMTGRERDWEVFEVMGSAVDSLLHALKAEIKERNILEKTVEELEERMEKVEGGGKRGVGHGGGEGEMRDWFARQGRAGSLEEFV